MSFRIQNNNGGKGAAAIALRVNRASSSPKRWSFSLSPVEFAFAQKQRGNVLASGSPCGNGPTNGRQLIALSFGQRGDLFLALILPL